MKYDKMNRRLFLQGLGKTSLALPLLPSLLAQVAGAQTITIPPRFVMLFFPYGPVADNTWYPSALPTTSLLLSPAVTHSAKNNLNATAHNMHYGAIPSNSAGISPMFDSKFVAYKNQMSILRGIGKNGKSGSAGHYGMVLLGDSSEDGKHPEYQRTPTIDQVMAYANGFYPSGATNIKHTLHLSIKQSMSPGEKMIWGWQNAATRSGNIVSKPWDYNPNVLYAKLFGHMSGNPAPQPPTPQPPAPMPPTSGGPNPPSPQPPAPQPPAPMPPTPQPVSRSATPIIDSVLEDFRRVRNGRAISSEDKVMLDNHMDLMAQLEKDLRPPAPAFQAPLQMTQASCTKPASPNAPYYTDDDHNLKHSTYSDDWGKQAKAFNDLIVAAFQCGLTRIATVNVNFPVGWHMHDTQGNSSQTTKLFNLHKKVVDDVAYDLISKMGAVTEGNGRTMLDNSLVQLSGGSGKDDHSPFNYPVVLWGSAGGQLNPGKYLDYRRRDRTNNGLLLSQLNCTIMRAMGLQPSDWNMQSLGLTGSKIPNSATGWGDYYNGDKGHQANWSLTEATYKHARITAGDWLPVLKA